MRSDQSIWFGDFEFQVSHFIFVDSPMVLAYFGITLAFWLLFIPFIWYDLRSKKMGGALPLSSLVETKACINLSLIVAWGFTCLSRGTNALQTVDFFLLLCFTQLIDLPLDIIWSNIGPGLEIVKNFLSPILRPQTDVTFLQTHQQVCRTCQAAAFSSVPTNLLSRSCHCYFLGGKSEGIPAPLLSQTLGVSFFLNSL